jgi:endosialidase-like protein
VFQTVLGLFEEDDKRTESLSAAGSLPKEFDDYELLDEIGRGGQGVVYRARQISLNRIVALKIIGIGRWATESHVKRFRLEAEAAARLSHSSIVSIGFGNTAIGAYAISGLSGSIGSQATAIGSSALPAAGALYNTADGNHALYTDNLGGNNLAEGNLALSNDTDGTSNIAVGDSAGINLTTGDYNIDLVNKGIASETNAIRLGKKGVQTATYIAGISGKTVANGVSVLIDTNNRLRTVNSSKRYKESIKPMANTSETILSLKPVTFCYKKKLDPQGIPQFGLVAEQVEKISANLVARDDEGKPFTIRYQAVNAMLLNEFAKEHRRVDERDAELNRLTSADSNQAMLLSAAEKEIAALKTTMKRQAAQIERMNAQLTAAPPPARLVTQR